MEPKDEDKLVVFGEYANEAEASIVKGVLETNGIPCILTNELLSSLLPMAPLKAGLVRLMVFDFDLEMAKKIMESAPIDDQAGNNAPGNE